MAQLRLMGSVQALALCGGASLGAYLVACRASEAGPSSGLTPPAGWRPLPELAVAASDAAKLANITVDGGEAWADAARGCYAAWLGMHAGAGAPSALADQMMATLPSELPAVTISDVVKPAANADTGVLSFGFLRPPYQGRVRAQMARSGAIGLLACYWNLREPIACEAACVQLIGSMK